MTLIEYFAANHVGTIPLDMVRISESGITFTFEGLIPQQSDILEVQDGVLMLLVAGTGLEDVHKEYMDHIVATHTKAETMRKELFDAYKERHKEEIEKLEKAYKDAHQAFLDAQETAEKAGAKLRVHGEAAVEEANGKIALEIDLEKGKALKSAYLGKPC